MLKSRIIFLKIEPGLKKYLTKNFAETSFRGYAKKFPQSPYFHMVCDNYSSKLCNEMRQSLMLTLPKVNNFDNWQKSWDICFCLHGIDIASELQFWKCFNKKGSYKIISPSGNCRNLFNYSLCSFASSDLVSWCKCHLVLLC